MYSRLPIQSDAWSELIIEIAGLVLARVNSFIHICPLEFIPICLLLYQGKVAEQLKDLKLKDLGAVSQEDNYILNESVLARLYYKTKTILEGILTTASQLQLDERQQKGRTCLYFFSAALAELQTWNMMQQDSILKYVRDLLDQPELISNELMLFYHKAQRPIIDECAGNLEKLVEQEVDDNFYISRKDHLVVALVKYCTDLIKSDLKKLHELEKIADTSP